MDIKRKQILDKYNITLSTTPCRLCNIGRDNVSCIPGTLYESKENLTPLVIVLSYPKAIDQDKKKIYQTPDNVRFKDWLKKASYSDFFMTNALKCNTEDNNSPNKKQFTTCSSLYLYKELQFIKPKVVVTLGESPLQSLYPTRTHQTVRSMMMARHEPVGRDYIIYSLHHPAFMDRGGEDHEEQCIELLTSAFTENQACQKS